MVNFPILQTDIPDKNLYNGSLFCPNNFFKKMTIANVLHGLFAKHR